MRITRGASAEPASRQEWLARPGLRVSRAFLKKLRSPAVAELFSGLVGTPERLTPVLSATEYKVGDYLTVHNDLRQEQDGAQEKGGGARRLAFVLNLADAGWPAGCGGSFVWCRPAEPVAPRSNSLTLFATSAWSEHFVEPVWADAAGDDCAAPGRHRFAWSGWYQTLERARPSAADPELVWLRAQLTAQLRLRAAPEAEQGGLHLSPPE